MVPDRAKAQTCRSPRCEAPAAFQSSYQYVTGRAGRVSTARKLLCEEHAAKFRAKYAPTEVPAETDSRSPSEVAFEQLRSVR